MQVVLGADERAHADDKEVAEAGEEGDDPDGHAQNQVGQQVLEGRDAVRFGHTGPHVRRVRAVLEVLEVSERRQETGEEIPIEMREHE